MFCLVSSSSSSSAPSHALAGTTSPTRVAVFLILLVSGCVCSAADSLVPAVADGTAPAVTAPFSDLTVIPCAGNTNFASCLYDDPLLSLPEELDIGMPVNNAGMNRAGVWTYSATHVAFTYAVDFPTGLCGVVGPSRCLALSPHLSEVPLAFGYFADAESSSSAGRRHDPPGGGSGGEPDSNGREGENSGAMSRLVDVAATSLFQTQRIIVNSIDSDLDIGFSGHTLDAATGEFCVAFWFEDGNVFSADFVSGPLPLTDYDDGTYSDGFCSFASECECVHRRVFCGNPGGSWNPTSPDEALTATLGDYEMSVTYGPIIEESSSSHHGSTALAAPSSSLADGAAAVSEAFASYVWAPLSSLVGAARSTSDSDSTSASTTDSTTTTASTTTFTFTVVRGVDTYMPPPEMTGETAPVSSSSSSHPARSANDNTNDNTNDNNDAAAATTAVSTRSSFETSYKALVPLVATFNGSEPAVLFHKGEPVIVVFDLAEPYILEDVPESGSGSGSGGSGPSSPPHYSSSAIAEPIAADLVLACYSETGLAPPIVCPAASGAGVVVVTVFDRNTGVTDWGYVEPAGESVVDFAFTPGFNDELFAVEALPATMVTVTMSSAEPGTGATVASVTLTVVDWDEGCSINFWSPGDGSAWPSWYIGPYLSDGMTGIPSQPQPPIWTSGSHGTSESSGAAGQAAAHVTNVLPSSVLTRSLSGVAIFLTVIVILISVVVTKNKKNKRKRAAAEADDEMSTGIVLAEYVVPDAEPATRAELDTVFHAHCSCTRCKRSIAAHKTRRAFAALYSEEGSTGAPPASTDSCPNYEDLKAVRKEFLLSNALPASGVDISFVAHAVCRLAAVPATHVAQLIPYGFPRGAEALTVLDLVVLLLYSESSPVTQATVQEFDAERYEAGAEEPRAMAGCNCCACKAKGSMHWCICCLDYGAQDRYNTGRHFAVTHFAPSEHNTEGVTILASRYNASMLPREFRNDSSLMFTSASPSGVSADELAGCLDAIEDNGLTSLLSPSVLCLLDVSVAVNAAVDAPDTAKCMAAIRTAANLYSNWSEDLCKQEEFLVRLIPSATPDLIKWYCATQVGVYAADAMRKIVDVPLAGEPSAKRFKLNEGDSDQHRYVALGFGGFHYSDSSSYYSGSSGPMSSYGDNIVRVFDTATGIIHEVPTTGGIPGGAPEPCPSPLHPLTPPTESLPVDETMTDAPLSAAAPSPNDGSGKKRQVSPPTPDYPLAPEHMGMFGAAAATTASSTPQGAAQLLVARSSNGALTATAAGVGGGMYVDPRLQGLSAQQQMQLQLQLQQQQQLQSMQAQQQQQQSQGQAAQSHLSMARQQQQLYQQQQALMQQQQQQQMSGATTTTTTSSSVGSSSASKRQARRMQAAASNNNGNANPTTTTTTAANGGCCPSADGQSYEPCYIIHAADGTRRIVPASSPEAQRLIAAAEQQRVFAQQQQALKLQHHQQQQALLQSQQRSAQMSASASHSNSVSPNSTPPPANTTTTTATTSGTASRSPPAPPSSQQQQQQALQQRHLHAQQLKAQQIQMYKRQLNQVRNQHSVKPTSESLELQYQIVAKINHLTEQFHMGQGGGPMGGMPVELARRQQQLQQQMAPESQQQFQQLLALQQHALTLGVTPAEAANVPAAIPIPSVTAQAAERRMAAAGRSSNASGSTNNYNSASNGSMSSAKGKSKKKRSVNPGTAHRSSPPAAASSSQPAATTTSSSSNNNNNNGSGAYSASSSSRPSAAATAASAHAHGLVLQQMSNSMGAPARIMAPNATTPSTAANATSSNSMPAAYYGNGMYPSGGSASGSPSISPNLNGTLSPGSMSDASLVSTPVAPMFATSSSSRTGSSGGVHTANTNGAGLITIAAPSAGKPNPTTTTTTSTSVNSHHSPPSTSLSPATPLSGGAFDETLGCMSSPDMDVFSPVDSPEPGYEAAAAAATASLLSEGLVQPSSISVGGMGGMDGDMFGVDAVMNVDDLDRFFA